MSYNVDSVDTPVLDAWMSAKDVVRLHKKHEDALPEGTFLAEMVDSAMTLLTEGLAEARVPLPNFWWYGEGSGHSFDLLKEQIAPHIHGKVEAILTWEGGDSTSGLVIDDGTVEECDVKMTLVRKTK